MYHFKLESNFRFGDFVSHVSKCCLLENVDKVDLEKLRCSDLPLNCLKRLSLRFEVLIIRW